MLRSILSTATEAYVFAVKALRPSRWFLLSYLMGVLMVWGVTITLTTTDQQSSGLGILLSFLLTIGVFVVACAYQAKLYMLALGQPDRKVRISDVRTLALASLIVTFFFLVLLSIFVVYLLTWPPAVLTLLCGENSVDCTSESDVIQSAVQTLLWQPAGLLIWIPTILIIASLLIIVLRFSNFGVATITSNRISVLSSLQHTRTTWGRIGLTSLLTYLVPTCVFSATVMGLADSGFGNTLFGTLIQLLLVAAYAPIVTATTIYTVTKYFREVNP